MGDLSFIMELSSVRFFYITPNPFTYSETKEDLATSACFHRAMTPSLDLSSDENNYGFPMIIILTYTKFPSVYYYKRVCFMDIVNIPFWSLNRGAIGILTINKNVNVKKIITVRYTFLRQWSFSIEKKADFKLTTIL